MSKKDTKEKASGNLPEQAEEAASSTAEETDEPEDIEKRDEQAGLLEEANARADEYLALAQRVQADFENYRRRNESVRSSAYAEGRQDAAAAMLPVLDNLERAAEA